MPGIPQKPKQGNEKSHAAKPRRINPATEKKPFKKTIKQKMEQYEKKRRPYFLIRVNAGIHCQHGLVYP
jgi:hypothetical protein